MASWLGRVLAKIKDFLEPFMPSNASEMDTRRAELKNEEFDVRDEFEQRSYDREQTRTGVVLKGKEKPTKVW